MLLIPLHNPDRLPLPLFLECCPAGFPSIDYRYLWRILWKTGAFLIRSQSRMIRELVSNMCCLNIELAQYIVINR